MISLLEFSENIIHVLLDKGVVLIRVDNKEDNADSG